MPLLRLGTRGSLLALKQTEMASAALRVADGGLEIEVVEVRTEGDRDQKTALSAVAGLGVFTADIEKALLDDRVDVAVHSLKDLPTEATDGLTIGAVLARDDARDAVISGHGIYLHELAPGSRVGTSSSRRSSQLKKSYPNLEVVEIRGNVDTRIKKLRRGEYEAIVLAAAGLLRLGRLDEATELLEIDEMMPAPGQGAIALQCAAADVATLNAVRAVDDAPTRAAVTAERAVLHALGGGCSVPVGAYGVVEGEKLTLHAVVSSPDGETWIEESTSGMRADPTTVGQQLAGTMLARGARELLERFEKVAP